MVERKPYVKPELEELGKLHDVTGGTIFDIGDILSQLLGGGLGGPRRPGGSH